MAKASLASNFFILCLLYILSEVHQHHQVAASKCDPDFFYRPYVHVKKKKNGGAIASLRSSGFLDLRLRNRVVLCINGPAVLYSDVERLDPAAPPPKPTPKKPAAQGKNSTTTTKNSTTTKNNPGGKNKIPSPDHELADISGKNEELKFKKGELVVFNHQCISINKVPMNVLKKMKTDQGKANPELMPDTQVHGKLVLGVFLIGNKEGHNHPELAWFKGPNYEYIKSNDKTIKDSSFILAMSNVAHCIRLADGTHIKVGVGNKKSQNNSNEVCRWSATPETKLWYSKVFQRGFDANGIRNGKPVLLETDYEFYDCPDADSDRSIILTMDKTPEPVAHVNYTEFDPFSLFNPNLWTPHGYRKDSNGRSGGDERPEDKLTGGGPPDQLEPNPVPCSIDPTNPSCGDSGDLQVATTLKDMQNVEPILVNSYEIVSGDCIPLPVYNEDDCTGVGNNGNRLLELVLELEPKFVLYPALEKHAEPTDDQRKLFPKYQNLKHNSTLSWKYDLMYLTSEIFSQLCMPFRPEMPYSVARVMGWYIYKAHTYGENMGRGLVLDNASPPPDQAGEGGEKAGAAGGASKSTGGDGDDGDWEKEPAKDPKPPPPEPTGSVLSSHFDRVAAKNDPWPILLKELERCSAVAKKENGGKGLKFEWEVGDDTGKWKIPPVNAGATNTRRKRSVVRRRPVKKAYPLPEEQEHHYQRSIFHNEDEHQSDHYDFVEDIDAETGSKVLLHREKREKAARDPDYYKVNGSKITTKYIQPGKTLASVKSEGTWGYAREAIQEYRRKKDPNDPRADSDKYQDYPENLKHCWNPKMDDSINNIVCSKTEELFFYEDRAEIEYELNIAIDLWWKIWATVIGFCNKAYTSRKSETFPRLYNSKFEYFFDPVQKEWKFPEDNEDLKVIFSEFLTEESQIWMDACLEASYVNSNSQSFRPPRPMTITDDKKDISNYFEEIPAYLYYRYHREPNGNK